MLTVTLIRAQQKDTAWLVHVIVYYFSHTPDSSVTIFTLNIQTSCFDIAAF